MNHTLLCYKNEKLKLTINLCIEYEEFIRQLKEGVIFYDTGYPTGNTEIINLRQFDKVIICNELLYRILRRENDEKYMIYKLIKELNKSHITMEEMERVDIILKSLLD